MRILNLNHFSAACEGEGIFYAPDEDAGHDKGILYVNAGREAAGVVSYITCKKLRSYVRTITLFSYERYDISYLCNTVFLSY